MATSTIISPSVPSHGTGHDAGAHRTSVIDRFGTDLIAATKTSQTNVRLHVSSNNGDTWTEVGNYTSPVNISVIALAANQTTGQLWLVCKQADNKGFRWKRIEWSLWTATAWTTGFETLAGNNVYGEFDICIGAHNLYLATQVFNGASNFKTVVYAFEGESGSAKWKPIEFTDWSGASQGRVISGESVSIVCNHSESSYDYLITASGALSSGADYGVTLRRFRVVALTGVTSTYAGSVSRILTNFSIPVLKSTKGVPRRVVRLYKGALLVASRRTATRVDFYTRYFSYSSGTTDIFTETGSFTSQSALAGAQSTNQFLALGFKTLGGTGVVSFFRYEIRDTTGAVINNVSPRTDIHYAPNWPSGTVTLHQDLAEVLSAGWNLSSLSHGGRGNGNEFTFQIEVEPTPGFNAVKCRYNKPTTYPGTIVKSVEPNLSVESYSKLPTVKVAIDNGDRPAPSSLWRIHVQASKHIDFSSDIKEFLYPITSVAGMNNALIQHAQGWQEDQKLTTSLWWLRIRLVDILGNGGYTQWSTPGSFSVYYPPIAVPLSPINMNLVGVDLPDSVFFSWRFTDRDADDFQTAYEIEVTRETPTVALIHNSGKVTSDAKTVTVSVPDTAQDQVVSWKVRLWDSENAAGPWSDPVTFVPAQPPTVDLTSPVDNDVLNTGTPLVVFTPTAHGDRLPKQYTVTITSGAETIWSKIFFGTIDDQGEEVSLRVDPNVLENNTNYTVHVQVLDSGGLVGSSDFIAFSTDWDVPDPADWISADVSMFNVDSYGYNEVTWGRSGDSDDFAFWLIYRRDQLFDEFSSAVTDDTGWKLLYKDFGFNEINTYYDYFARPGYETTYRVIYCESNPFGMFLKSDPLDSDQVIPRGDGYWIMDSEGILFKLSIVTGDEFSDESEETEFNVVGRGRVVNRGQDLGVKGTLSAQLRHTGGTSARTKRLELLAAQKSNRVLFLRNPFGDIYKISFSNMSVSRIAGTGTAEFCDVNIPYAEIESGVTF